jgi:hypothetical protein
VAVEPFRPETEGLPSVRVRRRGEFYTLGASGQASGSNARRVTRLPAQEFSTLFSTLFSCIWQLGSAELHKSCDVGACLLVGRRSRARYAHDCTSLFHIPISPWESDPHAQPSLGSAPSTAHGRREKGRSLEPRLATLSGVEIAGGFKPSQKPTLLQPVARNLYFSLAVDHTVASFPSRQ